MYTVLDYGRMADDGVRMDAYARAIARVVRPGSVVLDLGAGTGIFSLLAVRAGAKRVHAVEPNPAVWLVPELAAANGASSAIVVHPTTSFEVELPEPADVVISDMRGALPLHDDHIDAVKDARTRLMRPGGTLLPSRDRLFVAPVESIDLWRTLARGWESFEKLGVEARVARTSVLNGFYGDAKAPVCASNTLAPGAAWAELEYATAEGEALAGTVEVTATRGGVVHGLSLWFEATVHGDIGYTTAPGSQLTYGRAFLPLLEPVPVRHGDSFRITLRADARGTRWAWDTEIFGEGRPAWKARQSTFLGNPTAPEALLRSSPTHAPRRAPAGERALEVLRALDGTATIGQIAERLAATHPTGALGARRALEEVQRLVADYGA